MAVVSAPSSPDQSRSRRWRSRLLVIGGVTLGMWLVSAVSMWVYTAEARDPREYTLVIPPGARAAILAGENPLEIPATWRFQADDTLTLRNDDDSGHFLGTFFVPPHETASYVLRPSFAGAFACSLHPSGQIVVDVGLRGFDWPLTLVPTLAFGPVLGLVVLAIRRILRAVH